MKCPFMLEKTLENLGLTIESRPFISSVMFVYTWHIHPGLDISCMIPGFRWLAYRAACIGEHSLFMFVLACHFSGFSQGKWGEVPEAFTGCITNLFPEQKGAF